MNYKPDRNKNTRNSSKNSYESTPDSYAKSRRSARKRKFLTARQLGASVTDAARLAGIHPSTPYYWRNADPEFARAWREGPESLLNDVEMEAFRRAITRGNDRLLMFILKSHMPSTYNQRPHQPKPAGSKAANIADFVDKVRDWI